jgi:hypothetical protein
MASSSSRISYRRKPDLTAEQERSALAATYGYILRCSDKRKAAGRSGGDARREDDESGTSIIREAK